MVRWLFLFIFCSATLSSTAQDKRVITRITDPFVFDGIPDESFWSRAESFPMTGHMPVFNAAPTERTVVKMVHDGVNIYLGAEIYYDDPSIKRESGKKRDYFAMGTDWFGVLIDSYNDRENCINFSTNPNGLRFDASGKNDMVNNMDDFNLSFNTFWDVKTSKNESGWTIEFRIPVSSLRFQETEGSTTMGITIYRYIASKSEMLSFPPISPDSPMELWKASLTKEVIFEGLQQKKALYITPYATAGFDRRFVLNEAGTERVSDFNRKLDAGLDVKYTLSNNLALDLTFNTDFAQVEADDQKINLTRFSLFYPEKRLFFQEKQDVFDFGLMGGNNLFYSRRIGLYDGNPVRILGGARLTGRAGQWDIGIMDIQTASYDVNPSENFGVFRTKRKVFNQNSYMGGMLTSRLGSDGSYNFAYGLDGVFRVTGKEYLTVKLAQTAENGYSNRVVDIKPSRLLATWQRRTERGLGYELVYAYSGENFNPGMGFEIRDNYSIGRTSVHYGWFSPEKSRLRYHKASITALHINSTVTGETETQSASLTYNFDTKRGFASSISGVFSREEVAEVISLGNDQAFIPVGSYSFGEINLTMQTSSEKSWFVMATASGGRFFDGWRSSVSLSPTANISPSFDLSLTYNIDRVVFEARNEQFTNHIAGINALIMFNTRLSLTAFSQYNTAINGVVSNVRFRYNPREGSDFYIVYNEGLNTNIDRETPPFRVSDSRTLLLKYTYTFLF